MTNPESIAHEAFEDFSKWETYTIVFDLMDKKRLTLKKIAEIAFKYGIDGAVINARRRYFLQLRRQKSNHHEATHG